MTVRCVAANRTVTPRAVIRRPAWSREARNQSDWPARTRSQPGAARTVQNMDASLAVPTATSVRAMPVKLLFDNRTVINNHLARARGRKVSFTHLIGWAIGQAIKPLPEMNTGSQIGDGNPTQP